MTTRLDFRFALSTALLLASQPVLAADLIPGGEEHMKIMVGGIIASIDSGVGIDGTTGQGTLIDLNGPEGRKRIENVVVGAQWRVGERHRLSGLYFTSKKGRTVTYDKPLNIGNDTLVPPSTLDTESRNQFLFATYQYSFVKNSDVEVAALVGAYINKFTFDLSGTTKVTTGNVTTPVTKSVSYDPSVTVPMPLLGASLAWYVSPRFTINGSASGMKAKIGDVDGAVYVIDAGAEYMFTRNLGAGLAYMHARADVDITKSSFKGQIDWTNDNLLLYALLKF